MIFVYKNILKKETDNLNFRFTKRQISVPVVISQQEAISIINLMSGKYQLICSLLFGAGLRINEALRLRIKDLDFNNQSIFVFRGKGNKDRCTLLPLTLAPKLKNQINYATRLHHKDLSDGYGLTSLPISLIKKYGNAAKDLSWQYLFASSTRCMHPQDGYICRHHIHESAFRKQLRKAVLASGINKRVTAHTFKHSFATELLRNGADIRTVQELLGHNDVRTTEIYTHVIGSKFGYAKSPLDLG
ncbi:integron integrase [Saccharobesus litoralis]|uniref:Integron integrase n=1 Tax=Saccharobesus litoralis TaxID=2172099 RepID=A0A2S0VLY9_9ALTE|nr:integron integrase [Saccharobesus litoralis]